MPDLPSKQWFLRCLAREDVMVLQSVPVEGRPRKLRAIWAPPDSLWGESYNEIENVYVAHVY